MEIHEVFFCCSSSSSSGQRSSSTQKSFQIVHNNFINREAYHELVSNERKIIKKKDNKQEKTRERPWPRIEKNEMKKPNIHNPKPIGIRMAAACRVWSADWMEWRKNIFISFSISFVIYLFSLCVICVWLLLPPLIAAACCCANDTKQKTTTSIALTVSHRCISLRCAQNTIIVHENHF